MFKICSGLIHGTRGHINQINQGLSTQQELKSQVSNVLDGMVDDRFKAYLLHQNNRAPKKDHLIYPKKLCSNLLQPYLYKQLVNLNEGNLNILWSERALIQKKSKLTLNI
jgi:hypothetical protein